MSNPRFLNPKLRIFLCFAGAAAMAAVLYPAMGGDFLADRSNILRAAVFFGFLFFLIKDIVGLFGSDTRKDASSGE